jgi:hypothetical protein
VVGISYPPTTPIVATPAEVEIESGVDEEIREVREPEVHDPSTRVPEALVFKQESVVVAKPGI